MFTNSDPYRKVLVNKPKCRSLYQHILLWLNVAMLVCQSSLIALAQEQSGTTPPQHTFLPVITASNSAADGTVQAAGPGDLLIYADTSLAPVWSYQLWNGATANLASTTQVRSGSTSIRVTPNQSWGALSLGAPSTIALGGNYGAISFWVYGTGLPLLLEVYESPSSTSGPTYTINAPVGWTQVVVPFSWMTYNPNTLTRLNFKDGTGAAQSTPFYVDDIKLLNVVSTNSPTLIYTSQNGPASGWGDFSWSWHYSSITNLWSTFSGLSGYWLAVTPNAPDTGLVFKSSTRLATSSYSQMLLTVYNGASGTRKFSLVISDSTTGASSIAYPLSPQFTAASGQSTQITVDFSSVSNKPAAFDRINIQTQEGATAPTFYLTNVSLQMQPLTPLTVLKTTITIPTYNTNIPIGADPNVNLLLGSNLPAWLHSTGLADPTFVARLKASGVTVLRMPGGSWSNDYGWLRCELQDGTTYKLDPRDITTYYVPADALPCGPSTKKWTYSGNQPARPTDFIKLLKTSGIQGKIQGMWTISANSSPGEAAALVAFFNGSTSDNSVILYAGSPWKTVAHWALLRDAQLKAAGVPIGPVGIKLWNFGNEVYGSNPAGPATGTGCWGWGWENTWTCDGTEYVNATGVLKSGRLYYGYMLVRQAMRAVDASIKVGAVGYFATDDTMSWGNKVVTAAGAIMDFYDLHRYVYPDINPLNAYPQPNSYADVLANPQSSWSAYLNGVRSVFTSKAAGRAIPIGVTEYNLFSGAEKNDSGRWTTRAVNALFVADSIGRMAVQKVAYANQWNLANGHQGNVTGSEYGLLDPDNGFAPSPAYYVYPLWSAFGNQMYVGTHSLSPLLDEATQLSLYGGADAAGYTLLAINKTNQPIASTIGVYGFSNQIWLNSGDISVVQVTTLGDQQVSYNTVTNPSPDLSNAPRLPFTMVNSNLAYTFAPYSVTLLRLR
ncbi:MAG: hypothetical protein U0350_19185 [Caldilineaceae bacterium]